MSERDTFLMRMRECAAKIGSVNAWAKRAGIPTSTLQGFLRDRDPRRSELISLSNAAHVSVEWLATGIGEKSVARNLAKRATMGLYESLDAEERSSDFVYIPRYDVQASAGGGAVPGDESVEEHIPIPKAFLRNLNCPLNHLSAIEARGDSMEPDLRDGDTLLVDTSCREMGRDGLYILRYDDTLRVKYLQKRADGGILIRSRAPEMADEEVSPHKLADLHIVGRVRWHGKTV